MTSLEQLSTWVAQFAAQHPNGGVFGLRGGLGAGKTTLVRTWIQTLCQNGSAVRVMSPSFTLHQSYPELVPAVEHFDLYRLERVNRDGLVALGYYDALERARQSRGIVFVEWPEKAANQEDLQLTATIEVEIHGELRRFLVS